MKTARAPWYRSKQTIVVGCIVAGAAAVVTGIFVLGPNKNADPEHFTNEPAQVVKVEPKAPFDPAARQVAMRFVQTAVAREHLDEAWELSGPTVRGGLSRAEWMTGNIPVVPFPLDKLEIAPFKVDESHPSSALVEIALLAKKNSGIRSQIFFMELKKVGTGKNARWVVDNWVPRASAVIPR